MKFVFEEPIECNLHLIREFYANWDPQQADFSVQIRGQAMKFEAHVLNTILGTPETDPLQLRC